jgi:hypothetical protein
VAIGIGEKPLTKYFSSISLISGTVERDIYFGTLICNFIFDKADVSGRSRGDDADRCR